MADFVNKGGHVVVVLFSNCANHQHPSGKFSPPLLPRASENSSEKGIKILIKNHPITDGNPTVT